MKDLKIKHSGDMTGNKQHGHTATKDAKAFDYKKNIAQQISKAAERKPISKAQESTTARKGKG